MSDQFTNEEVTSDDKLWALLAYVLTPLVPVIILLMEDKKNRPFLKAHNVQALVFRGRNLCFRLCSRYIYFRVWFLSDPTLLDFVDLLGYPGIPG